MQKQNLLATAAEMRELDRRTIEEIGIPGAVLMENAGRATVEAMERHFGPVRGKEVIIFAGPGNNGGDGLVIARRVADLGGSPFIVLVANPAKLPPDAARNWDICERLDLPRRVVDPKGEEWPTDCLPDIARPLHSVVDALFGVGLKKPLAGIYRKACDKIEEWAGKKACPVVAVDMPSGLHASCGEFPGHAICQTHLTVTYGLAKPGLLQHGGPRIGKVEVVDIGIPPKVLQDARLPGRILDKPSIALPQRRLDCHKGNNGHVLVLAASTGKTGAAILAAKGALAAGAGLVTVALPADLFHIVAAALPEAMTAPMPTVDHLAHGDIAAINQICEGKSALVLGPGLGLHPETEQLVLALYQERPEPMVVDADALNILANHRCTLAHPGGPRVLTPHPGEMARLLGKSVDDVQRDRLSSAQQLCELCKDKKAVAVVHKGAGTVIATNEAGGLYEARWAINTSGNPGMATGGMGDVLAGILGALLDGNFGPPYLWWKREIKFWNAVCSGVWLHSAAADLLARKKPFGYTAGEVAEALPRLYHELMEENQKRC